MASKKAKQKKVLDKAKQLVLKNKKGKAKAKPKQSYPEGQNAPQSKAYQIDNDKTQVAKATGYRFTTQGAKRLGKTESDRPTTAEIEKYRNQTFKVKGKVNKSGPKGTGDGSFRYIYIERRADKADLKRNQKLAHGGIVKDIEQKKKQLVAKAKQKGIYENFGQKEVQQLQDKYGHYSKEIAEFDNWAMNFDTNDLKKYAHGGSIDDKRERVIDYYLNNDVFDDYDTYGLTEQDLMDAKKSKSYKKIEDAIVKYHGLDDDENVEERFEVLGLGDDDEYAKGGKIELRIHNVDKFDKHYDEVGFSERELSTPYQKDGDNSYYTKTKDDSIAQQLQDDGLATIVHAKGGKTKDKKAVVVSFNPMTRVIVSSKDSEEKIVEKAREKMRDDLSDYLSVENLDEIKDDSEMPYNEKDDYAKGGETKNAWGVYYNGKLMFKESSEQDAHKSAKMLKSEVDMPFAVSVEKIDDDYAKGGKTKNLPTKQEFREFQEYVFSFYGKDGIYGQTDYFEGGATTEEILLATNQYLSFCAKNPKMWGKGDSVDREIVRDIMQYHRGTKISELEHSSMIQALERTTILEYGGILQPMIGGVNADPRFDIYNTTMFAKKGAELPKGEKNPLKDMNYSEMRTYMQDKYIDEIKNAEFYFNIYETGDSIEFVDESIRDQHKKIFEEQADYLESNFEKKTGLKVVGWELQDEDGSELNEVDSGNTYNWSYLGGADFNYRIYESPDKEKYYLMALIHMGGDIRGNYGDAFIFEGDSKDEVLQKFSGLLSGGANVYIQFKDGSSARFDSQQDSDVWYFEHYDDGELEGTAKEFVSDFDSFGSWHGDEFLEMTIEEFHEGKKIHSYEKGGKVLTRKYLQSRGKNVFTFGYGMPKDAIDMYGTKGGSEYFVMPNGDVYKKTTADMHKFELIDVKDKS